jgi:hypothetical protein
MFISARTTRMWQSFVYSPLGGLCGVIALFAGIAVIGVAMFYLNMTLLQTGWLPMLSEKKEKHNNMDPIVLSAIAWVPLEFLVILFVAFFIGATVMTIRKMSRDLQDFDQEKAE